MSADLDALAQVTGHTPGQSALYIEALTHGSHGQRDYQRLEFLGDRVLGLVMADALYAAFPNDSEGQLSARLNAQVTGERCAEVARAIGLAPLIRLGKQAMSDGGRDSDNILGDVMEAVIGALYLDGGLVLARRFILDAWGERVNSISAAPKHPKSALLEWSARHRRKPPAYIVEARDGPDHAPRFTVAASIPNVGEARAVGPSKQEAEKAAAALLLAQVTGEQP